MMDINFANGHTHQVKNRWEELTPQEFIKVLEHMTLFMSGIITATEFRQRAFLLVSGLKPSMPKDAGKSFRKAENIYHIARRMNFMFRIEYAEKQSFSRLNPAIREKLERYLPGELDTTPEVRWATKAKKMVVPDLAFARNLIPAIKGRKGYTFDLQDQILVTSLTTSQFIDAQTVAGNIQETGADNLLNLLLSILYCTGRYDAQQAAGSAGVFEKVNQEIKKAVFINFNAIQEFIASKTKYTILFNSASAAKKPKHDLGLGSVVHSLVKTGYSNIEDSNLMKFFEVIYSDLISNITSLQRQGHTVGKISEYTGLSIAKINQII